MEMEFQTNPIAPVTMRFVVSGEMSLPILPRPVVNTAGVCVIRCPFCGKRHEHNWHEDDGTISMVRLSECRRGRYIFPLWNFK